MISAKHPNSTPVLRISCIILSYNSDIDKDNSIFHCLLSVLSQSEPLFEIVLVENSLKDPAYLVELKRKVTEWNKKRFQPVPFTFIKNSQSFSSGKARNIGVKKAKGEILVFIDDDTIIGDQQAFAKIDKLSYDFDYGFGAKRLWTLPRYFSNHTSEILKQMEDGDYSSLFSNTRKPLPKIRSTNSNNPVLSSNTFIANFGFCKKEVFNKVAGFPDFPNYGFEDDYLMFKLYKEEYKHTLLKDIDVIHVTHALAKNNKTNLLHYFCKLIQEGYYWFHIELLFRDSSADRERVLEKLATLHYDKRIESSFQDYQLEKPLDLQGASDELQAYWVKNNRLGRIEFVQTVNSLQKENNLDSFIKNSKGDFDNLAEIIKAAQQNNVIKLKSSGQITSLFDFHFTTDVFSSKKAFASFSPKSTLNQFPCDIPSRERRKNFLKERYPFAEYLRFGIIGDDDLISLAFTQDYWAWPIILEKDQRITKIIRDASSRFKVYDIDICNIIKIKTLPRVQTFITDPPYTFHGVLAFITAGLHMLAPDDSVKEFYVIINPIMIGRHLENIQRILISVGVYLTDVLENFSQYELPLGFIEKKRADNFLSSVKVNPNAVHYSSSSSLYIFKTRLPNIQKVEQVIDHSQLYNHYV